MELNIADLFESVVDAIPDRVALVCGDRRLTFRALEARANRLAHHLAAKGVKAGDHVGLYLYNGTEFVEAMLAAFKLRAVPININYRYVEDELLYLFDNADVKACIHQREFVPILAHIRQRLPLLTTLVSVDDTSGQDGSTLGATDYEQALAGSSSAREFAPRSGDDLYIIYTGGTTGMPKGVMWRHKDVFYAGLQGGNPGGAPLEKAEDLATAVKDRGFAMTMMPAAPFIHGAAQWTALIAMFMGGKTVLAPGRSFNANLTWKVIAEEKVNLIALVGDAMVRPLAEALAELDGKYDISSLMVISSAGAILSSAIKAKVREVLPNIMILNSFGASEVGHAGNTMPGDDNPKPTFMMDANTTVFDEEWKALKPGSGAIGKLGRKGKLPIGYYKDPEKTAATFLTIDGERWVVAGDLATIEADGRITLFGRGSVCINSGGEKIFPEEVEDALKGHPAVMDAVVVGVPDERWGQRVCAVVQPRPGTEVDLPALDAHCRTKIAGYKIPRELHIVAEIARHPSGKPDYRWAKATALGEV
jgi:acyl-CoA synthetase (AMP-forming)/AMP-acid ligase II